MPFDSIRTINHALLSRRRPRTTSPSAFLYGCSSDHTPFKQAGLPGVSFGQDPIEYFAVTWHTNLDTYERIIEADARTSATVIAAAIYQLATRDEMLPRFNRDEMPAPPTPSPTPARP